uniref:Calponin-homology (CH) domain-containing protein n=1 Tax=Rhabditophanes sp. KR3021 TaxID=114890 RepID=A0AC35TZW6_9BILA
MSYLISNSRQQTPSRDKTTPVREQKHESQSASNSGTLLSKFGTFGRKKKPVAQEQAEDGQHNRSHTQQRGPGGERDDDADSLILEKEGKEALDSPAFLLQREYDMDEGEQRRFMTLDSKEDPRVKEIFELIKHWLNQELAEERIVVKSLTEDMYDGQIFQKLIEKLANIKIEVPEVCQSEIGQKQKMQIIVNEINSQLGGSVKEICWTSEQIHQKDLLAIVQLLIQMALFYRAPIRFPEDVNAQVLIAAKKDGRIMTGYQTEQLTTVQKELAPKGERDAFDTLFDYGPDKLAHVKSSLVAFCNRHLNKINLEVTDLDYQFQDGVFLILMMGLLEGYFVPLHSFHLQVSKQEQKMKNVEFAFFLMLEAGMPKPKSRVADIVNGDVKSTLRVLHSLFTKYKHV